MPKGESRYPRIAAAQISLDYDGRMLADDHRQASNTTDENGEKGSVVNVGVQQVRGHPFLAQTGNRRIQGRESPDIGDDPGSARRHYAQHSKVPINTLAGTAGRRAREDGDVTAQ